MSENESNLGFEYRLVFLNVVELVIVSSLSFVKGIGVQPFYRIGVLIAILLSVLLIGSVVNYWVLLLLGIVYIGGVVVLLVYVGVVGIDLKVVGISYIILLFVVIA